MDYNKLEAYELTGDDIKKILTGVNIIKYENLKDYYSLNDCFNGKPFFIIFLATTDEYSGHWLCMLKQKGFYLYWDSYGLSPLDDLGCISHEKLEQLGEDKSIIIDLFKRSAKAGMTITHNTTDYQAWGDKIDTCGRWVCVRCLNWRLTEKQFYDYVTNLKLKYGVDTLDEVVCKLIYDIVKK